MSRVTVQIPIRWGDLDAFGHVNNVAVAQLLEEARILAFWDRPDDKQPKDPVVAAGTAVIASGPQADVHTIIARHEIEYLLPIEYRESSVEVQLWISKLGGASIDVCYEVFSEGQVAVKAKTIIVLLDAKTMRPQKITPDQRAAWEPYVEADIEFRRPGAK